MPDSSYKGQRLSFENNLCTVRYVGPVKGTKGDWLGVEWDDASRGKHAGEHQGVKYFDCLSKSSTSASFVRPSRSHDKPRTFVDALSNKYVSTEAREVQANQRKPSDEDVIRISGKDVEEVGFDKIRRQLANLQELRVIVLDGQCIGRSIGETGQSATARGVKGICPKTIELDVSRNLFETWREVLELVSQLLELKTLKLDGNRFSEALSDSQKGPVYGSFDRLQSLSLDNCLLSWQHITSITANFPNIRNLSAGFNGLRSLPSTAALTQSLTSLHLEENDFTSLDDLKQVARLHRLERLSLKNNKIDTISGSQPRKSSTLVFPRSLSDVDLAYNRISEWSFINDLATVFPGLETLRVTSNPLYKMLKSADGAHLNADDAFMLTMARLASLKRLNYSEITPKERLNAETYYLSHIAKELSSAPEEDAPSIITQHPRYAELCQLYFEPVITRKSREATDANSLTARLVRCRFHVSPALTADPATAVTRASEPIELQIPRSFSIYNVLGLVGKRVGLPPMLLELVWETGEETVVREDELGSESGDDAVETGMAAPSRPPVLREEVLVPRTRLLGTWLEGREATLRVQWSDEDVRRRKGAGTSAQDVSPA